MTPVYITFTLYLILVLGIGFAAYSATRNFDDYILGGRSLGSFVTAMSAGASDMSGWLFWSVMVARWSDAYYYRMARREIADAIEMYPRDEEKQLAHIRRHGGVSLVGLALAFGFYAFSLFVIQVQFLPIYAKQKANATLFEVLDIVESAQGRVDAIYKATGQCPVNTPLSTDNQKVVLKVLTQAESIPTDSHCMIQATVRGVPFPNRWLNGQTLTMYRIGDSKVDGSWGCITSLNRKQIPKQCMLAER